MAIYSSMIVVCKIWNAFKCIFETLYNKHDLLKGLVFNTMLTFQTFIPTTIIQLILIFFFYKSNHESFQILTNISISDFFCIHMFDEITITIIVYALHFNNAIKDKVLNNDKK